MMDAASPTAAMSSIFEHHAKALDDYVEALVTRDGQVGAIFVVADALFGLDGFDQPSTVAALLPELARSYGIDALERRAESEQSPALSSSTGSSST